MDRTGTGSISLVEFRKVAKDCRVKMSDSDCDRLFRAFDSANEGKLYYEDFLSAVTVSLVFMPTFRAN